MNLILRKTGGLQTIRQLSVTDKQTGTSGRWRSSVTTSALSFNTCCSQSLCNTQYPAPMPYPLSPHYPWVAKADTTHFQKDPAQKTTVKNFQVFQSSLCCIYNVDKAEVTELTGVIVMVTAEQFRLHCCWASPDKNTEWRLTGAIMCVLTKSLILILFTSIFTNFKLQRGLPQNVIFSVAHTDISIHWQRWSDGWQHINWR